MHKSELQPGLKVKITDSGFECLNKGDVRTVFQDAGNNEYYVTCDAGIHYLNGQYDELGRVLGFEKYTGIGSPSAVNTE